MWQVTKEHFLKAREKNGMEHIHPACTWTRRRPFNTNDWGGREKRGGRGGNSDVKCYPIKLKINSPERRNLDTGVSHSVRSLRHLFTTWHNGSAVATGDS